MPNNPYFYDSLDGDGVHMRIISLMGVYQCKTLIKHLIKCILRGAGQQKQLFYGLSALLSAPVCFSRQQLKWRNPPYRCCFMLLL